MRVIGNIPHPSMRITVFIMNDKYVMKFEAGPLEQAFKIPLTEVKAMEGIEKMLDEEFMKKVVERFNEMFISFQQAREKHLPSASERGQE